LWQHQDVVLKDSGMLSVELRPHCSAVFRVEGQK
jgi:hypothetical protein